MKEEECSIVGCDNRANYYDCMDNPMCIDCVNSEIEESKTSQHDYVSIKAIDNQKIKINK